MESGNDRTCPSDWHLRRNSSGLTVRFKSRCQVIEDVVTLLPTGRSHSQQSLHYQHVDSRKIQPDVCNSRILNLAFFC